jgi:hypothetical protein
MLCMINIDLFAVWIESGACEWRHVWMKETQEQDPASMCVMSFRMHVCVFEHTYVCVYWWIVVSYLYEWKKCLLRHVWMQLSLCIYVCIDSIYVCIDSIYVCIDSIYVCIDSIYACIDSIYVCIDRLMGLAVWCGEIALNEN